EPVVLVPFPLLSVVLDSERSCGDAWHSCQSLFLASAGKHHRIAATHKYFWLRRRRSTLYADAEVVREAQRRHYRAGFGLQHAGHPGTAAIAWRTAAGKSSLCDSWGCRVP